MQETKIGELSERAALMLEEQEPLLTRKLEAQQAVMSEIEAMRREDEILTLTEEEERMLRSFRGFKARTKPGGVFRWQTRPDDAVVGTLETSLITDPQDVSQ